MPNSVGFPMKRKAMLVVLLAAVVVAGVVARQKKMLWWEESGRCVTRDTAEVSASSASECTMVCPTCTWETNELPR